VTDIGQQRGHRWFAAAYDSMMRSGERRTIGKIRRELLHDVHGDVLEIGAGTGLNFEHYPSDARVVALEPDPYMLKRAMRRLRTLDRRNIDVRTAPAEHLPFDAASFDAVVSTLVLCTVGDVAQSLTEVRRVLRPGGEFRFLEHVRAEGLPGRLQDLAQPIWSWVGAGCHPNRRTEAAIRSAGFEVLGVDRERMNLALPVIYGIARTPA